jgi:hypothetical protein
MPSTVYDDQDRPGLRRPRRQIRQEGHRRAPRPLRDADADAEYHDPSRSITYFNAMIGEANYFNSRPADPEKQLIGAGFREIFCGSHGKRGGTGGAERSAIPTARSATACSAASTSTPAIP